MAKRRMLLSTALQAGSALRDQVADGLGAFATKDVQLIAESERTKVGDSLDLDEACRNEHPEANRWDYLVSVPASTRIVGLEPHTAKDSEISVVIAKKKQAVTYLRNHLPPKHRVANWIWVTHGKVGFTGTERARRRLDQEGIVFAGRVLRSFD